MEEILDIQPEKLFDYLRFHGWEIKATNNSEVVLLYFKETNKAFLLPDKSYDETGYNYRLFDILEYICKLNTPTLVDVSNWVKNHKN